MSEWYLINCFEVDEIRVKLLFCRIIVSPFFFETFGIGHYPITFKFKGYWHHFPKFPKNETSFLSPNPILTLIRSHNYGKYLIENTPIKPQTYVGIRFICPTLTPMRLNSHETSSLHDFATKLCRVEYFSHNSCSLQSKA